jgi:hypothetical protein
MKFLLHHGRAAYRAVSPALVWEFAMTGEMEWRYRHFARQGKGAPFAINNLNGATGLPDQRPRACWPCEQRSAGTGSQPQAGMRPMKRMAVPETRTLQ